MGNRDQSLGESFSMERKDWMWSSVHVDADKIVLGEEYSKLDGSSTPIRFLDLKSKSDTRSTEFILVASSCSE